MIRMLPLLMIAACTTFPALEGTISDAARNAPYPTLTPVPLGPPAVGDDATGMTERVAALQARAAGLRQIDMGALQ